MKAFLQTVALSGGKRKIIAFIQDPIVARDILVHLGLKSTAPPIAPARGPPQQEFEL